MKCLLVCECIKCNNIIVHKRKNNVLIFINVSVVISAGEIPASIRILSLPYVGLIHTAYQFPCGDSHLILFIVGYCI